jgi:hypothetical protein
MHRCSAFPHPQRLGATRHVRARGGVQRKEKARSREWGRCKKSRVGALQEGASGGAARRREWGGCKKAASFPSSAGRKLKAAERKLRLAEAQYKLGSMYGIDEGAKQDYEQTADSSILSGGGEARRYRTTSRQQTAAYYQEAAEHGVTDAHVTLVHYSEGTGECDTSALRWRIARDGARRTPVPGGARSTSSRECSCEGAQQRTSCRGQGKQGPLCQGWVDWWVWVWGATTFASRRYLANTKTTARGTHQHPVTQAEAHKRRRGGRGGGGGRGRGFLHRNFSNLFLVLASQGDFVLRPLPAGPQATPTHKGPGGQPAPMSREASTSLVDARAFFKCTHRT